MRIMIPTALAVCFFMANAALAADSAVPTVKIGVVDMQDVATRSEPAHAARKQMESKFGKERQTLEKQGEDLKKRAESLKSAKTSEEKKLDFIRAKQALDQKTRNFLRQVEQEEIKLRQEMMTLAFSASAEIAQAKGFNFIVDVTAGGVLYADKPMDLTEDVLTEVNRLYKKKDAEKPQDERKSDKK
jgi:outer membrane protein